MKEFSSAGVETTAPDARAARAQERRDVPCLLARGDEVAARNGLGSAIPLVGNDVSSSRAGSNTML